MSRPIVAAALAALCCALPAQAFVASNGMRASSTGPQSFAVPYSNGRSSATDYWCAAGDYVIRVMGKSPSTRIYRTSAGPIRKRGVTFSLSPDGAVASGLNVFGAKDAGISASLAQVQCSSMLDDDFRG